MCSKGAKCLLYIIKSARIMGSSFGVICIHDVLKHHALK